MTTRRILIRRDTAAAWTAANPTLASGELGGETDTGKLKLGNGSTAWNSLAYQGGVTSINGNTGVVTGIAPTASPTLTGTPLAPTAAGGTNTTQIATTEFVQTATSAFVSGQGFATANNASFTGTFSAPAGTITSTMIADGTIANADINASAAISTTKITGWEDDQIVLSQRIFS